MRKKEGSIALTADFRATFVELAKRDPKVPAHAARSRVGLRGKPVQ